MWFMYISFGTKRSMNSSNKMSNLLSAENWVLKINSIDPCLFSIMEYDVILARN